MKKSTQKLQKLALVPTLGSGSGMKSTKCQTVEMSHLPFLVILSVNGKRFAMIIRPRVPVSLCMTVMHKIDGFAISMQSPKPSQENRLQIMHLAGSMLSCTCTLSLLQLCMVTPSCVW